MSDKKARKLKLFHQGSAALENLNPEWKGIYGCPICERAFTVDALESGDLTLEHAPPNSIGGRDITLTCRGCNSGAGHTVDAQVRRREDVKDFATASMGDVVRAKLSLPGMDEPVNVTIHGTGSYLITGLPENNNPETQRQFEEALEELATKGTWDGAKFNITLPGVDMRKARIGDLRTAYLVAFAALGYRFAFNKAPALEYYVAREHSLPEDEVDDFEFDGVDARFVPDYSHIWDQGQPYRNEQALGLLNHLEQRLGDLAEQTGEHEERQRLLGLVVSTSRLAIVWRRLLRLGARHPEQLGLELRPLVWSHPILTCLDTSAAAGEMIRAIAPHLPHEDRERIERAILSIPEKALAERRAAAERTRDRLLRCLPESGLVTAEARERLETLSSENAVLANEDDRPFIEVTSGPFGEAEFLAEEGVPVEDEANRHIRKLEEPVKQFGSDYLNKVPDKKAIGEAVPHLRALRDALRSCDVDGVHPKQANHAWGTLAKACVAVAKAQDLSCQSEAGTFVREVLLDASENEIPEADPEADAKFDDPYWEGPAARIEAAAGLATLTLDATCADEELLAAIDRLSADSSPAARFQIAVRLLNLYEHSPIRCWALIERIALEDRSRGVLRGLVQPTLFRLRFNHPDRVADLVISIYHRTAAWPEAENVLSDCVDVLGDLFVAGKNDQATEIIQHIADHPLEHLEQACHLAPRFREILTDGPVDGSDSVADAVRLRAMDFLLRLTRSAADAFRRGVVREGQSDDSHLGERPTKQQMEQLAHLLDAVGWNLYFVSGAHKDEEIAAPGDVQARLLQEAGPIIDQLADVGLPSLAHHLLETLNVLIPFDPQGVFMRIAAVIRGGRKGAYQYDQMAQNVLVGIVERYLAEYREIFQKDEDVRRALIGILDTFVHAGSVGARRLSYGLDGIFR